MSYTAKISRPAAKQLEKLPLKDAQKLYNWVETNLDGCTNPTAIGDCKQLRGRKDVYRYRVGKYRIITEIIKSELIIAVVRIGHRQGVYNK